MRELILNHSSLRAPDRGLAVDWLKDVAVGIAALIGLGVAENALRSVLPHQDIECAPEFSLFDAILNVRAAGGRDESTLLMRLTTKIPLLSGLPSSVKDRFLACENLTLTSSEGEPLVLCAITAGITVGFPSNDVWANSQLSVRFEELLTNGEFQEQSQNIDNLTRSSHASQIAERHRSLTLRRLVESRDVKAIWGAREEIFPQLVFGLDVEKHLEDLNPGLLNTVCNRLSDLHDSAIAWQSDRSSTPPWRAPVTDESDSVKNNARLREARRFRSRDGSRELFYWHAHYGGSGRIHLRFDPATLQIEIGYIGPHLLL